MNCACRTAALRIFVRSVAQLHIPEASQSRITAATRSGASFWTPLSTPWTSLSLRGIHGSTSQYGDQQRASATTAAEGVISLTPEMNEHSQPEDVVESTAADVEEISADHTRPARAKNQPPRTSRSTNGNGQGRETKSRSAGTAKSTRPDAGAERPARPPRVEQWQAQKEALKEKFPEGWQPRKRLSPDALEGIRALHAQFPDVYTTDVLADKFEISPEAIRRILRSRWTPSPEEEVERQERWFNRGKRVWAQWAELGKKPPQRWRREGIVRKPHWNEKRRRPGMDNDGGEEDGDHQGRSGHISAHKKLSKNLM